MRRDAHRGIREVTRCDGKLSIDDTGVVSLARDDETRGTDIFVVLIGNVEIPSVDERPATEPDDGDGREGASIPDLRSDALGICLVQTPGQDRERGGRGARVIAHAVHGDRRPIANVDVTREGNRVIGSQDQVLATKRYGDDGFEGVPRVELVVDGGNLGAGEVHGHDGDLLRDLPATRMGRGKRDGSLHVCLGRSSRSVDGQNARVAGSPRPFGCRRR